MQGALEHIKYKYPESVFDEIKYTQSVNGVIDLTFDQQGMRAVLTHYIYFTPLNASNVGQINFLDQFGQILFSTINSLGVPNWAPIPLVRKGNILKISCSNITVRFSVSYQLILNKLFPVQK